MRRCSGSDWLDSRRRHTVMLHAGSTMLLRLTEGCRVPVRLDSVAGGAETGHIISAVYFIGRCTTGSTTTASADGAAKKVGEDELTGSGGQLRLQNIEAAAPLAEGVFGNGNSSSGGSGGGGNGSSVAASLQEGKTTNVDSSSCNNNGSKTTAPALDHHRPPAPPPPCTRGMEKTKYSLQREECGVLLEPTADRLVLFRSGCVSTETLEVKGHGREQYAMLFWMHEAKEGVGDAAHAAAPAAAPAVAAGVGGRAEAAGGDSS